MSNVPTVTNNVPETGFQSFAGEKVPRTLTQRDSLASNQPNVHVPHLSVNPGEKLWTTCAEMKHTGTE